MRAQLRESGGGRRSDDSERSAVSPDVGGETARAPGLRGPVATSWAVEQPPARQFTFTWMLFGFASGFFGRWTTSTPCFDSARIFSASMLAGSEKARVNVP